MTPDVIENHWATPATPVKLQDKRAQRGITKKGRVIQGEKGIGRFALLKLGRTITLTTRAKRSSSEQLLTLDVSAYNTDFIDEDESALFRSEEHTSELQSLMRISYAVFCLKKKKYR